MYLLYINTIFRYYLMLIGFPFFLFLHIQQLIVLLVLYQVHIGYLLVYFCLFYRMLYINFVIKLVIFNFKELRLIIIKNLIQKLALNGEFFKGYMLAFYDFVKILGPFLLFQVKTLYLWYFIIINWIIVLKIINIKGLLLCSYYMLRLSTLKIITRFYLKITIGCYFV